MDVRAVTHRALAVLRVPQALPALGFLGAIVIGSAILSLPWLHQPGAVGYLDALFTSTSAVCVTGLVTVNTANAYTVAGQVVIIILVQIGGLGVMTYAAMALSILRRRMSLRTQAALHDALFQRDEARDFKRRFRQIIIITLSLEAAGTLLLFLALLPNSKSGPAAWSAVFHSISSFCNAGFSIFPDNMVDARANHFFLAIIMILIVLGGLGYTVLIEVSHETERTVRRRRRDGPRRFSLHTNVVLRTSLALTVGGAVLMLLFGLTGGEQTWGARIENSLFQSISARTCGFNTVAIGALPVTSWLVLVVLMFIGGSPGSCAGGVKTTSLAVMIARVRSYFSGEDQAKLLGRRLSRDLVRSAELLFVLAVVWNLIGLLILAHFEEGRPDAEFRHLLFEQISAFGNVGLSTSTTTAGLSVAGKLWIVATMYVGRLGPLTLASLAMYRRPSRVAFPEGKVMIG
jgi:trk system potassium uptake protein TrkH